MISHKIHLSTGTIGCIVNLTYISNSYQASKQTFATPSCVSVSRAKLTQSKENNCISISTLILYQHMFAGVRSISCTGDFISLPSYTPLY